MKDGARDSSGRRNRGPLRRDACNLVSSELRLVEHNVAG